MVCIDNYGNLVTYDDGYSTYELYHHGIRGQRWGRKNGPPYPLDASDHSAAERKAGWTKSLASVAKATGKGVAKAARATGHGVKVAAKGTKKALIRVNLYPKKLMSAEDIAEKVERMRQEDTLKHAMGKLSNEDKLMLKMKAKDARREIAKQTLTQLLPAIGKDLIIPTVKQGILNKLDVKKKEAMNEVDLDFKEETNTLDSDNKHSEKIWNDAYESALAAGKSIKEAKKIADQGGNKELGKKSSSQEDKERDKKVWNDLYEDARAAGKTANEAKDIANSGKSDIPARKNDGNGKNGGNSNNKFNLENEIEKDIYNTAKKQGFTPTESAEMARNKDDSKLKGSSSSGNDKETYDRYLKAALAKGAGQKEAENLARRRQETLTQDELDAAYAENKRITTNRKREATVERNTMVRNATDNIVSTKKNTYKDKSTQDRLKDAIESELKRTIEAIEDSGGKNISVFNGVVAYETSNGKERTNHYADRAADDLERQLKKERKNKKG